MSFFKKYWQWTLFIIVVGGAIFWNSSYNPFKSPPEIGTIVTKEQLQAMLKDKENDGKRIALVGRPRISNFDIVLHLGKPTGIRFENKNGDDIGSFGLYHGEGKNEFSLPREFKPSDLKIYDQDGKPHAYDEYVMISFTLEREEAASPEKDPKTGEYVWYFTNIRIDSAP